MTTTLVALALGTLLAVGALAFVLYPLFFDSPAGPTPRVAADASAAAGEGDTAVVALREIEFDRATGKLSDADYAQLKGRYTAEALAAIRGQRPVAAAGTSAAGAVTGALTDDVTEDEIEAAVHAYRAHHPDCRRCGPRPEPDALYCSRCGRYLRGACDGCGAPVEEPGFRFCSVCGHRLAA